MTLEVEIRPGFDPAGPMQFVARFRFDGVPEIGVSAPLPAGMIEEPMTDAVNGFARYAYDGASYEIRKLGYDATRTASLDGQLRALILKFPVRLGQAIVAARNRANG